MSKDVSDIPIFLTKPMTTNAGLADEDAARLAGPDTDEYVPEQVEADPALAEQLAAISGEQPAAPEPVASPSLTSQADVPYFTATDGLGRDLATKIAEAEQRLNELAHDIELSRTHRTEMVERIQDNLERTIRDLRDQTDHLVGAVESNHLNEVAILRGRETDIIKGMSALKATLSVLQR